MSVTVFPSKINSISLGSGGSKLLLTDFASSAESPCAFDSVKRSTESICYSDSHFSLKLVDTNGKMLSLVDLHKVEHPNDS